MTKSKTVRSELHYRLCDLGIDVEELLDSLPYSTIPDVYDVQRLIDHLSFAGWQRPRPASGRLDNLGRLYETDKATFHGYCDFYEQHLPTSVDRLLEIGVMDGASLRMWRDYYPRAKIIGAEIDPGRAQVSIPGVTVIHADATSRNDVDVIRGQDEEVTFDVIIDDGSHMTQDQQTSFVALWPSVAPGGCYVIEDLHTSYIASYLNSERNTIDWLRDMFGPEEIVWFRRAQGDPAVFLGRHGIAPSESDWYGFEHGLEEAESISAIVRKPI